MNYVMLALAGILSGGIVFGAKILFMSGATLFEVMLFPNLIGAALFTPFVVKEFKRFIGVPPVITLLFTLSVLLVNVGDYVPLFMNVSVTLVLLLVYLQPIWTIMIERFYFKKHIAAADWVMVAVMFAGLIILINPFQGIHYSLVGMSLALFAGLGESVWILITKYFSKKEYLRLRHTGVPVFMPSCRWRCCICWLTVICPDMKTVLLCFLSTSERICGFRFWCTAC